MVTYEERLDQMWRAEKISTRLGLLLMFLIGGGVLYLYITYTLSNAQLLTALILIYATTLLRGYMRMQVLLRFNSDAIYKRYVRLEFLGAVMTIIGLSFLAWNAMWPILNTAAYIPLALLMILPFLFIEWLADDRLKEIDPEHVTNKELRNHKRRQKVG